MSARARARCAHARGVSADTAQILRPTSARELLVVLAGVVRVRGVRVRACLLGRAFGRGRALVWARVRVYVDGATTGVRG